MEKRTFTDKELQEIIIAHGEWVYDNTTGKQADFSYCNLTGKNFRYDDLSKANFAYAILRNTDFTGSNLCQADLHESDLTSANFTKANLSNVNLTCAVLHYAKLQIAKMTYTDLTGSAMDGADLSFALLNHAILDDVRAEATNFEKTCFRYASLISTNFYRANLAYADFGGANLCNASLSDAKIQHINYDHHTSFFALQCPESGSFIGYKKANNCLVTLKIPKKALRSSATSRKCRCNKAKVLSIKSLYSDGELLDRVRSSFDDNFEYVVGETAKVSNFNMDRWQECASGIHFFMTKNEAIQYM